MTTSHLRWLAGVSVVALLVGGLACTSAVQSFKIPDFSNRLRRATVHVRVTTGAGATSISGSTVAGITAIQILPGGDTVLVAARRVQFELLRIGFRVMDSPSDATMYVDLTLNPRFDPIGGWIADEAQLEFIDVNTGELLASYRAHASGLVTPSVNNLVSNLIKDVRADY